MKETTYFTFRFSSRHKPRFYRPAEVHSYLNEEGTSVHLRDREGKTELKYSVREILLKLLSA